MKVVKATGLVPVQSNTRGGRTGIFGVSPATARQGLKDKVLTLVDIPNDIETYEVAGWSEEPQVVPQPNVDRLADIDIPEGWEDLPPLVLFNLAKRIDGKPPALTDEQKAKGLKATDVAKLIVEAEVQRRAAAEKPVE